MILMNPLEFSSIFQLQDVERDRLKAMVKLVWSGRVNEAGAGARMGPGWAWHPRFPSVSFALGPGSC